MICGMQGFHWFPVRRTGSSSRVWIESFSALGSSSGGKEGQHHAAMAHKQRTTMVSAGHKSNAMDTESTWHRRRKLACMPAKMQTDVARPTQTNQPLPNHTCKRESSTTGSEMRMAMTENTEGCKASARNGCCILSFCFVWQHLRSAHSQCCSVSQTATLRLSAALHRSCWQCVHTLEGLSS